MIVQSVFCVCFKITVSAQKSCIVCSKVTVSAQKSFIVCSKITVSAQKSFIPMSCRMTCQMNFRVKKISKNWIMDRRRVIAMGH